MDIYIPRSMPSPARRHASNTNAAKGAKKLAPCIPPKCLDLPIEFSISSDFEDDFPTPRANPAPASPTSCTPRNAKFNSITSNHTVFEEDADNASDTDGTDDSEMVPFKLSTSMRRNLRKRPVTACNRPPSLAIPSPSLWPKAQRPIQTADAILNNVPLTPLSPQALDRLNRSCLLVPAAHALPSLTNGSCTTDETPNLSCPPTPSLGCLEEDEADWESNFGAVSELSCELPADAMETLLKLSSELPCAEFAEVEAPIVPVSEPQEMSDRGLNINLAELVSSYVGDDEDQISPISVPSPGGFFSSMRVTSAEVWPMPGGQKVPDTSTAERFYGVPVELRAQQTFETLEEQTEEETEDPVTASRLTFDIEQLLSPKTLSADKADDEVDADYDQRLSQTASVYSLRTNDWIQSQEHIMQELRVTPPLDTTVSSVRSRPTTPKQHHRSRSEPSVTSPSSAKLNPSKKAVRFADDFSNPASATATDAFPSKVCESDSVLYYAFQHQQAHAKARDAYTHRTSRADALRMQRQYRRGIHRQRLRGSFDINDPTPKPEKPCFHTKPLAPEEEAEKTKQRNTLAGNSKTRRALEQLDSSNWNLQAIRFLQGGTLLHAAAHDHLTSKTATGDNTRVLDFGGQPTASFGWALAVEHRPAKVYTVCPAARELQPAWLAHRGPSNHRIATAATAWSLPFPSAFFDVISARSLHLLLRMTRPTELEGKDEWEATLKELHRVLKPDGVLHFCLLDAEVSAPSTSGIATKSVEFAVALRTRGYDPCAGRHMLQRFAETGFGDVKQGWMSLPWASVTPACGKAAASGHGKAVAPGNDAVTGLVGSLAWEEWMLKFQMEMGKAEEALLEGVPEALDEARKTALKGEGGTSWRMLVGCARKG